MTDGGANAPVAPEGNPVTVRFTVCAAPEVTCVVTVYVVLDPWATVWFDGLALMEKSSGGTAVRVRLTVVEWVVGGDAYWPVTVRVNVPIAADAVVPIVSVELCPAVTSAGLNVALAPEGSPLANRLTVRAVPDATCVLTVYVVLEPATIVRLAGAALMEKSSGAVAAVTVRMATVECDVGGELYWPVIVKPKVPVAAVAVVDTVRVEFCPALIEAGLKLAFAPDGNPVAERLTVRAAPAVTSVLTVYVVAEPWTTL
ncbi:MAG: hypothetical protein E6I66_10500 [Chloroflexi bacterium]|nr:MAG: hypothetical protein E6I66_10500 [Chloroflexota bacterium]